MRNILLVSENESLKRRLKLLCDSVKIGFHSFIEEKRVIEAIERRSIEIVCIDVDIESFDILLFLKKLKVKSQIVNIPIILICDNNFKDIEVLKLANSYILKPICDNIAIAVIYSSLKIKNSLDILSANNTDLAKSLYQLDVLYSTSSKFAGTLDKEKLIDVMLEGLEKSLSFELSYTLIYNDTDDFSLIINSVHPLSRRFEEAIKLRALLSYNTLFDKKETISQLNIKNIDIKKHIKHQYEEYDLNLLRNDSLFAPIAIGEKFFGLVEVFREQEFSQEDATCFQTIAQQVSLPLESAILYEEIKNTNTKLEKLERMKSEFISIVSHELRTPLTAIKNSLDIILNKTAGPISESIENFLTLAKRNVSRLSNIINDLLDLSKIEAGKMEFHFKKSNINNPVEFVKKTFESLAREKNISIEFEKTCDIENVYIDCSRIEQIVTNLVSNAIKFTNENGKIKIKTEIIDSKNLDPEKFYDQPYSRSNFFQKYVKVSIEDNGIGIAKKDQSKVFDKFEQIEQSLDRKTGGTGLGLSIAKQLVNCHRGFIWLESEPCVKTVFSFVIPCLDDLKIFNLELENQLKKAKINKLNIGVIGIKEDLIKKVNCKYSLIEDIEEGKLVVNRQMSFSHTISITNELEKIYLSYIMNADKFALDFVKKKIETYLSENRNRFENCDILFTEAIFPTDFNTVHGLFEFIDKTFKRLEF